MTLAERIDAMCAAARKRLHQRIERRAQYHQQQISRSTLNRALGQLNRRTHGV